MDRLYSLAMGIPFAGRSYTTLECILLHNHRRAHTGDLLPCDVYQGFRTRAREHFANLWDRGPHGFVRRADPLHPGPYIHYGWQAPPVTPIVERSAAQAAAGRTEVQRPAARPVPPPHRIPRS